MTKNTTSKALVLLSGIVCLAAPVLASDIKTQATRFVACGDTPFGKLNPSNYLGSNLIMMCGKTYKKNGVEYIFNNSGQLYAATENISSSDIPKYTKKYGKPDLDNKAGNEFVENRQIGWNGSEQSVLIVSVKTQMSGELTDATTVSYLCRQIDEPKCDKSAIETQKSRLSDFVKQIVPVWTDNKPSMEDGMIVDQVSSNLLKLGYPGVSRIKLQKNNSGGLGGVCCYFNMKEYSRLKSKIFSDIGDIVIGKSEISISLANDIFSLMLLDESASSAPQVTLCFTSNRI